jgi:hypothetical protein
VSIRSVDSPGVMSGFVVADRRHAAARREGTCGAADAVLLDGHAVLLDGYQAGH